MFTLIGKQYCIKILIKKLNVIIFTRSGSWGVSIFLKPELSSIKMVNSTGDKSQVLCLITTRGGGFLDTYRSRISKIIHMHFIFLTTVVSQPLSICQNKLDSSFFSLIIIYNSAEGVLNYYYRVEI